MKQFQSLRKIKNVFDTDHYIYTNNTVQLLKKSKAHIGYFITIDKTLNGCKVNIKYKTEYSGHVNINTYREAKGGGFTYVDSLAFLESGSDDNVLTVTVPETRQDLHVAIILNANKSDLENSFLTVSDLEIITDTEFVESIVSDEIGLGTYITTNYLTSEAVTDLTDALDIRMDVIEAEGFVSADYMTSSFVDTNYVTSSSAADSYISSVSLATYVTSSSVADTYISSDVSDITLNNRTIHRVTSDSGSTTTSVNLRQANTWVTIDSTSVTSAKLYATDFGAGQTGNIIVNVTGGSDVALTFSNQWWFPSDNLVTSDVIQSGKFYNINYYAPTSDYIGPIMIKYAGGLRPYTEERIHNSDANISVTNSGSGLSTSLMYGNRFTSGNSLIGKVLTKVDIATNYTGIGPSSYSLRASVRNSSNVSKGTIGWVATGVMTSYGSWTTFQGGNPIYIEEDDSIILEVDEYTEGPSDTVDVAYWRQGASADISNATLVRWDGSDITVSTGNHVGMRTYAYDV